MTSGLQLETPVVSELRNLESVLKEQEVIATENRNLTETTWDIMQSSGVLQGLQPKRWGGREFTLHEHITNVYELSRIAPSAGWVSGVVGSHPWQIALFPEEVQEEFWAQDSTNINSSSYAPTGKIEPVKGGYKVSGRWSFSSGSDHCESVVLGGFAGMIDLGGFEVPNFGSIILYRDQYKIEDTWVTAGLRGTGSRDIVVDDVFVPEHRFLSHPKYEYNPANPAPGLAGNNNSLYKLPWAVMFNIVLVAPALGIARNFIDQWTAETETRKSNWGGFIKDDALLQLHLADAEWIHDAAVKKMFEAIDTIEQAAADDVFLDRGERARMRWNITKGCQEVGHQVDKLLRLSSGRTAFVDHPLHKGFQDVSVAMGHAFLASDAVGQYYGASLLNTTAPEVML